MRVMGIAGTRDSFTVEESDRNVEIEERFAATDIRQAVLVEPPGALRQEHIELLHLFGVTSVIVSDAIGGLNSGLCRSAELALVDVDVTGAADAPRLFLGICPAPRIVAMSARACSSFAFRLGRAGFSAYLELPASVDDLRECLGGIGDDRVRLGTAAASLVGRVPLKEAQRELRSAMLQWALHATRGSRRSAARLLGVTRPAVQRMLRETDDVDHDESSDLDDALVESTEAGATKVAVRVTARD